MKISVVVAAKNESKSIKRCLESVSFADEVIVIDDNSTDDTAQICEKLGAKVFKRKLDGFAKQKNFGIDKARNDWVLILDADERVSEQLASEIQKLRPNKDVAYSMPFKNHIGSRWVAHGGLYPDKHTRLFNKSKARYGDRQIHEMLEIDGSTAELDGDIIHYTYSGYGEYLEKVNKYARLEAATRKEKPKFRHVIKEFLVRYIKLQGFKDGLDGLVSAILLSYYLVVMRRFMK